MSMFSWFEKKDVPPDVGLIYEEFKKLTKRVHELEQENKALRDRDEKLRRAINVVNLKIRDGDKRSLWEQVFGHKGGW